MRFLIPFIFAALLSGPAQAFTEDTGMFDGLQFVSETDLQSPQGGNLALCHVTRDFQVFGFPLMRQAQSYVLSADGCATDAGTQLTATQMEAAQSFGFIDESLPTTAKNSQVQNLRNAAPWIAIAIAMIFIIFRRIASLFSNGQKPMRQKASERILLILCYVGKCDGIVEAAEIATIAQTAQRLTGRAFKATEIIHVTDHLKLNLTLQDYINMGKGLRDAEKDTMMRAAFYVALANGRMLPAEHEFLKNLAIGIGMPGEDFRRVMNATFADLDIYPPARAA